MNRSILIIILLVCCMSCVFLSVVTGGFAGYFYLTNDSEKETPSKNSPSTPSKDSTSSGGDQTKKKYKVYNKDNNICLRTVNDGIDESNNFGCRGSDESWYFTEGGNLISTTNDKPLGYSGGHFVLNDSQNNVKWEYNKDKKSLKIKDQDLCLDLYDHKSVIKYDPFPILKTIHYADVQMLKCDSVEGGQQITMEEK